MNDRRTDRDRDWERNREGQWRSDYRHQLENDRYQNYGSQADYGSRGEYEQQGSGDYGSGSSGYGSSNYGSSGYGSGDYGAGGFGSGWGQRDYGPDRNYGGRYGAGGSYGSGMSQSSDFGRDRDWENRAGLQGGRGDYSADYLRHRGGGWQGTGSAYGSGMQGGRGNYGAGWQGSRQDYAWQGGDYGSSGSDPRYQWRGRDDSYSRGESSRSGVQQDWRYERPDAGAGWRTMAAGSIPLPDEELGRGRGAGWDQHPWNPERSHERSGGGFWRRLFGRGPKGYKRSDERIREDIHERLYADDYIDSTEVTIEVKEGHVTLEGTVPERRMRYAVEDLVENIHGVSDIDNHIRVQRSSESTEGRGTEVFGYGTTSPGTLRTGGASQTETGVGAGGTTTSGTGSGSSSTSGTSRSREQSH